MCENCEFVYDVSTLAWHDDAAILGPHISKAKELDFDQKDENLIYGVQLYGRTELEIETDIDNVTRRLQQGRYASLHIIGRSIDIPDDGGRVHVVGRAK